MRFTVLVFGSAVGCSAACGGIRWTPCSLGETPVAMECGSVAVPLDYTDTRSNASMMEVKLQRAPAVKNRESAQSILLNFGGPGADGILDFVAFAERMQAATGGGHHLINLVPRGTNDTLPFSCFDDAASREAQFTPLSGNASDVALGFVWAKSTLLASRCAERQNQTGRLIGTAFVARDMMRVVDALGEDGMLRYWGVSYGTLLGSTLAAMFPDRIDKVVLDGVVNPFEYYANRETEVFTDADSAFRGFVEGCVANRTACPLAQNHTADSLEASIATLLQSLKARPLAIPVPGIPSGGLLIDYSAVSALLHGALYSPKMWADKAALLASIVPGGGTIDLKTATKLLGDGDAGGVGAPPEALFGIKCSDMLTHTTKLDDMLPVIERRHAKSRFFGDVGDMTPAACAQWLMPAKERYTGDFSVTTRRPLLVIGNTHDPVTPLVSARNVSATFRGSVLLQQDSYGHDSLMQASLCTARAIRAYFASGQLPDPGTKCGVEVTLFSGEDGWSEVIAQLAKD